MSILVTFMASFTRLVCIGASIRGAEYKGNTRYRSTVSALVCGVEYWPEHHGPIRELTCYTARGGVISHVLRGGHWQE